MKRNNIKRGQEEMVGFAAIIIIVSVILLIFLSFSMKNPQREAVESYEIESFINTFFQYTSDCQDPKGYPLTIQQLISDCISNEMCLDNRKACEVLETTLSGIIEESWKVSPEHPVKGYVLNITSNAETVLTLEKGNITNNYKGDIQYLPRDVEVSFSAYY